MKNISKLKRESNLSRLFLLESVAIVDDKSLASLYILNATVSVFDNTMISPFEEDTNDYTPSLSETNASYSWTTSPLLTSLTMILLF